MKNKKTLKIILLILILIMTYLIIQNTYSKYVTQSDSYSSFTFSKWNIKLNNKSIMDNADFSQELNIKYESSDHIADGVVVPTSKGVFDLSLESTGTELPYQYEIIVGDPKPYTYTINSSPAEDDSAPYLYDISLSVTNENAELTPWSLSFELPENLLADNCTLENITDYTIENNKIIIESTDIFAEKETKTFNMELAFENNINLEIQNVTLNDINFDYLTDKISDFRITSYSLNNNTSSLPISQTSIKGIVTPPANITDEVILDFIFTIEWYDDENNILDNFEDVQMTANSIPATVPVTVKITQLADTP